MKTMLTRRDLLAAMPSLALAPAQSSRPAVALIITEYRYNSHADVIGTRLLGGYDLDGKRIAPRVAAVSMFTDQVPDNDMSRPMAARHRVPLYDTVREALTLGKGSLAVDGVVVIGEHGRYPYNEKLQHMYPRYELYQQVVEVFRASGRTVPVFCDKHLSVDWWKAKWMYDQSREMKFPLLAGSSVPISWRRPDWDYPLETPLKYVAAAAYGGTEAYGFHALESMQVLAERRRGGETGVAAVRSLEGPEVWRWTDANAWAVPMMEAAVSRSETRKQGNIRELARNPALFIVEYRDGLKGVVYMLNGAINDFNAAGQVEGRPQPDSTLMWLQPGRPYSHFSMLAHYVEELVIHKREPYPVERTLLTTGTLAALMESAWKGGVRIETPHLAISYKAPAEPKHNRGAAPRDKEDI